MKFNEIFEYPLTKPIPYGTIFHVFFGVFQFIVLVILVVWGAATAGYETITISSPNYNMTQTFFYDRFIPNALLSKLSNSGLCNGAISFTPGASFSTTNDIFSYDIGSYYSQPGSNTSPSDVVEYNSTPLDSCAPSNILITVDAIGNTVDAIAVVICYGVWSVVATNHYAYSTSGVKSMLVPGARNSIANTIWTNDNSTSLYIFRAMDDLASDVLGTLKLVRTQTNGTGPSEYSINLELTAVCPIAYFGVAGCPTTAANWSPGFNSTLAVNTYSNGSTSTFNGSNQNLDMLIPIKNLASALYSATVFDLGSTTQVNNNIFTNLAAQTSQINTTNTNATTPGVTGSTLTGATAFTKDTSFPIPATGDAVIRATYLCQVKQLKSAAGFIIAVGGLALSYFSTFVTVATIALVILLKLHRNDLMYCVGHSNNPSAISLTTFDPNKVNHSPSLTFSPVPTLTANQPNQPSSQLYAQGQGPVYPPNSSQGYGTSYQYSP